MSEPHQYPHIFIPQPPEVSTYKAPQSGGGRQMRLPNDRDPASHGKKLSQQLQQAWQQQRKTHQEREAVSLPTRDGIYLEFRGKPGFDLQTKSLEDLKAGIRLLNIRVEGETVEQTISATVFVPAGQENVFLKKLNAYVEKPAEGKNPKNNDLVRGIEDIRLAILDAFWQDFPSLIPTSEGQWCEAWLRVNDTPLDHFRELCSALDIDVKPGELVFPERVVLLIKANQEQLISLIESSDCIAEFRLAKETARFLVESSVQDQTEWVKELQSRLEVDATSITTVCVIDTGCNAHPLLTPILAESDKHSVEPAWGTNDSNGHGTLMSGLAAFGNLQAALENRNPIILRHRLESSKIIPEPGNANDKALYGLRTNQAISLAEIQQPEKNRIHCLAVSTTDDRDKGRPSSWSGALDEISSGALDETPRLIVVAAGNVFDDTKWKDYPHINDTEAVHDPGQAWNALTVGAYTEKTAITDATLSGYEPLAESGGLSPFTTTSLTWEDKWPNKPDIVLEGGNAVKDASGFTSVADDLSLLTTSHQPLERLLDVIHATSAATAQASWMAAQVQAAYANAWPETVRGLLVHSAEWTEALLRRYAPSRQKKKEYGRLVRACGYGVPNLQKALACRKNSLTLIAQETMQPFDKKGGKGDPVSNTKHLYELPWPKEVLLNLPPNTQISMKITLSYFVEPGPGEIGWKDRYRYPSHGFRFDVRLASESKEEFIKRLDAAAREEGERIEATPNQQSTRWLIGSRARNKGSIHSDILKGSAAEMADYNMIGIYPVTGWWKERHYLGKWNKKTRYSLIVSLYTPEETIDIYTPVAIQLGIPITVG